jgi:hypothetical protein
MAQSLAMENQARSRNEASIMHNLRSLKMGKHGVVGDDTKSVQSNSTEGRLNEARQNAKVDAGMNMRTAGAKAYKKGNQMKADGKGLRGGAMKHGGRLLNRAGQIRKAKDKKDKGMATMAFQQATGGVLRSAWISLIPSYGLTLIWINIHAFMRWIFPKFFCKLGSEWIPRPIKKVSKTAGIGAYYLEAMALVLVDVLVVLLIVSLGVLLVMIAGFWTQLIIKGVAVWGWAWDKVAGSY